MDIHTEKLLLHVVDHDTLGWDEVLYRGDRYINLWVRTKRKWRREKIREQALADLDADIVIERTVRGIKQTFPGTILRAGDKQYAVIGPLREIEFGTRSAYRKRIFHINANAEVPDHLPWDTEQDLERIARKYFLREPHRRFDIFEDLRAQTRSSRKSDRTPVPRQRSTGRAEIKSAMRMH